MLIPIHFHRFQWKMWLVCRMSLFSNLMHGEIYGAVSTFWPPPISARNALAKPYSRRVLSSPAMASSCRSASLLSVGRHAS